MQKIIYLVGKTYMYNSLFDVDVKQSTIRYWTWGFNETNQLCSISLVVYHYVNMYTGAYEPGDKGTRAPSPHWNEGTTFWPNRTSFGKNSEKAEFLSGKHKIAIVWKSNDLFCFFFVLYFLLISVELKACPPPLPGSLLKLPLPTFWYASKACLSPATFQVHS